MLGTIIFIYCNVAPDKYLYLLYSIRTKYTLYNYDICSHLPSTTTYLNYGISCKSPSLG